MANWDNLLSRPDGAGEAELEEWFGRIAGALLNGCRLMVGKRPHRFIEVETYYCGEGHPDPFTHRDPMQLQLGRWYFHRSRGTYRSGSFKGVDLSFGDGKAFGGMLVRGIEKPGGEIIDGPSLCVDYLLDATGAGTVAALDRTIAGRLAWDPVSPMYLEEDASAERRPICRSSRVGLSLKKARGEPEQPRFVMRPYRYLSQPGKTAKGRPHVVLALHAAGQDVAAIREMTGCPERSIRAYIADFEAGRQQTDFASYFGIDLGPREICRLAGTWHAVWRRSPEPKG
jgi:hypothetical protein